MPASESRTVPRHGSQNVRDPDAGLALYKAGRRDRAEQLCRKILRREPNQPQALHLLGRIAAERGRHEYAVQLILRALAGLSDRAEAHHDLGNALRALERFDKAADHYRAAIALRPDFAEAHCNLSALLLRREAHEAALEHATRAAELMPQLAAAHYNRAVALTGRRRFAEAEAACRSALARQPQNAEALSTLGYALTVLRRIGEALVYHRAALELQPNNPLFHLRLASAQFFSGDPAAGEASCRRALSFDPHSVMAWTELGEILKALGRFAEARSCLRRALELDPQQPGAYAGLAVLGERAGGAEPLQRLRALLADPTSPVMARIDAGFALGTLFDNADRYDEAFPCFSQANALYGELLAQAGESHDRAAFRLHIDSLIEFCTPELYATLEERGNPAATPVFVVGMPRSGTTLVEQIAASHSRVAGAGELPDIGRIFGLMRAHAQENGEEEADSDLAHRLADDYVARLQQVDPQAERVIDKMPGNILLLGMAALLFPRARIVFCRRDPRDTCLSCYFHQFAMTHPWAYDLGDCGSRALEVERLADHWRRVLPLPMLTIDYEALVADLEGESRRLIAFLGLDWEPACLDFHRTERPVMTASGWQVRQPLFTRSVGRWRHYQRHLGPLLDVLAEGAARPESAGSAADR